MIDSIGFTDAGDVFLKLAIVVKDQPMSGMWILKPDQARKLADDLRESAGRADEALAGICHERDGANTH